MNRSFEDFIAVLNSWLTDEEKKSAVIYAVGEPVQAGSRLHLPGFELTLAEDTYIAFADKQPMANWGHAARYIMVNKYSAEVRSVDVRFPPFGISTHLKWLILYQPAEVPSAMTAKFEKYKG